MNNTFFLIAILSLIFNSCSDNSSDCPTKFNNYSNFKITSITYSELIDLDSVVLVDYGSEYRMADWQDLLKIISIQEFAKEVGIKKDSNYYVKNNGEQFWLGTNRHYFASRFDHQKPDNYLAHDQIDSNFLCLGSWFNNYLRILLVKK